LSFNVERWPWDTGIRAKGTLQLREVSNKSLIDGLAIEQVDDATIGDRSTPRRLIASGITAIAPDGALDVPLEADRDFPIGTVKGKLEIRSRRLAQQQSFVPFEVTTKIFEWVIPLWFVLCGLAGYVFRHVLERGVARAEALTALRPVLKRAERQRQSHPDPARRTKLSAKIDQVDAKRGSKSAEIAAATEELRKEVAEAEASRRLWLEQQMTVVSAAEAALSTPWFLPRAPEGAELSAGLAAVANAIERDEPEEARQRVAEAAGLAGSLLRPFDDFEGSARMALAHAEEGSASLPERAGTLVVSSAASSRERLDAIPAWDPERPLEIGARLGGIHRANSMLVQLARELSSAFVEEVEAAVAELANRKLGGLSGVDLRAAAALETASSSDGPVQLERVLAANARFASTVREKLTDPEALKAVSEGKYTEAIRKQLKATPPRDGLNIAAPARAVPRVARAEKAAPQLIPADVEPPGPIVKLLPSLAEVVRDAESTLPSLQLIGSLVSAIGLGVVTWVVYRDAWIGTVNDFAIVGAVAFSTDFTVNALVEAVGKLRR